MFRSLIQRVSQETDMTRAQVLTLCLYAVFWRLSTLYALWLLVYFAASGKLPQGALAWSGALPVVAAFASGTVVGFVAATQNVVKGRGPDAFGFGLFVLLLALRYGVPRRSKRLSNGQDT